MGPRRRRPRAFQTPVEPPTWQAAARGATRRPPGTVRPGPELPTERPILPENRLAGNDGTPPPRTRNLLGSIRSFAEHFKISVPRRKWKGPDVQSSRAGKSFDKVSDSFAPKTASPVEVANRRGKFGIAVGHKSDS